VTESNPTSIWQSAYLAVAFETDKSRMLVRIMEARAAIEQRLLLPIEEESEEYLELRAAQKALDMLKAERIDDLSGSN
jgi:hypothetical protein